MDKSFLGFFDLIPGQNLCIFMPSEPLYVDKFKVIFGKYILTYKMSRDRFGFLLPTIEKEFEYTMLHIGAGVKKNVLFSLMPAFFTAKREV